jgi:preprotein translocase subunit SecF
MLIPVILLVLSFAWLGYSYATTGEFVQKGISLKGGISVSFEGPDGMTSDSLKAELAKDIKGEINVRTLGNGVIVVESADADEKVLLGALRNAGITLDKGRFSIESFGSALGKDFFTQTLWAVAIAFVLMSIVVFITFRSLTPSLYVVLAVVCTSVMTLATISIIGVQLSTAGIAAFLMLIGYSVDTDILLTTRVIKRKEGTVFHRIIGAADTGLTMTGTALVATTIALFMSESDVIRQIMLVLTIGLLFDLINTWLQNTGLLRLYLERKARKHGGAP